VELDLSDNAFGPNGMKGLTKLLQSPSCFTLEVLRLHNNGLGTTGGKVNLPEYVCFFTSIFALSLSVSQFCVCNFF